jgi:hypothetical protein
MNPLKKTRKSRSKNPLKKIRKSRSKNPLKKIRKSRSKLAGALSDFYKDSPPLEQTIMVLDLVKKSKLDEIITDEKTRYPLKINSTSWSKLSYWNAYNIMMKGGSSNIDDMKNIVYMLKHDVYQHKKNNKEIWKKHITDAIFKQNFLILFQDINYNGPMIKKHNMSRVSLKDITIILLEHRIEILKWLEAKKGAENKGAENKGAENKGAENKGAENKKNVMFEERSKTPEDWENMD